MSRLPARPGLLAAAGALLALSVGLPWGTVPGPPGDAGTAGTTITGSAHPMRFIGLLGLLVLAWAIRRGSRRAGWAAVGIAVLALPTGLDPGHPGAGRVCYLLAIAAAAAWAGLVRPGGRATGITRRGRPAQGR
jgi:hypothetical protein